MTRLSVLSEGLFHIERELELLTRTFRGVHAWERVRFQVQQRCLGVSDAISLPAVSVERRLPRLIRQARTMSGAILRNPFLVRRPEILIFGHPRRVLQPDGLWWDIYADPYLETTDRRYVYCEFPYRGSHRAPAKTRVLRYLDVVHVLERARRILTPRASRLPKAERSVLADAERQIAARFHVRIELAKLVEQSLSERARRLPIFELLLRRLRPELVLIVCSYGNETFVEACKMLGIPVVELQHGVISRHEVAYSYPDPETTKRTFPDYLFAFGKYWNGVCRYPISKDRILPIGFPYQEMQCRRYEDVEPSDRIVFLSQWTVAEDLARLAVEVARQLPASTEVLLKLHPRESRTWRERYPWLADSHVTVIDSDDPPLYELLATSRMHIGVSTTALFEGLAFERETIVVDLPTAEHAETLVQTGRATLVRTAEELLERVTDPQPQAAIDPSYYFRRNALRNMDAAVAKILDVRR